MSVYSVITLTQLEQFLKHYSLGEVIHFEGIQEGVENTNYRVTTTTGTVILTIFESLNKADLSHILQLLQYLKEHSLCCPSPFLDKSANTLLALNTKQAAIFNWIPGEIVVNPSVKHCYEVGLQLGKLHQLTQDYHFPVDSHYDWVDWTLRFNLVKDQLSLIDQKLIHDELVFQKNNAVVGLPVGVIHGDLFKDNVLFLDDKVSGLLDFYSAGTGVLLMDIAIAVNDWCLNESSEGLDDTKLRALLSAYETLRPLSLIELNYLPIALRAAALRFWLSRLELKYFPRDGVMIQKKDPLLFRQLLDKHRSIQAVELGSYSFNLLDSYVKVRSVM